MIDVSHFLTLFLLVRRLPVRHVHARARAALVRTLRLRGILVISATMTLARTINVLVRLTLMKLFLKLRAVRCCIPALAAGCCVTNHR
ncbi:MAG TPA: hypothetical protein VNZ53_19385 [Steroidobacteraceae bacterium]|nr:hypothetical protein [Steroidobacteraceae bacterium]